MPMEPWLLEIEQERFRARGASHDGRLRTSARRIAGLALAEYRRRSGPAPSSGPALAAGSFIALLTAAAHDPAMPDPVRASALRLEARVGADFSSPSTDPLGDAEIIVDFVRSAG